ncbi:MAG: GatB/YqeY domain-containing protein [Rhodothermales bacterium]
MIQEQIIASIKDAMRAKDKTRLNVLRGIKTAFVNELVASKRTPQDTLSDEEATTVLSRLAKQRKESITQFTKGDRPELAAQEASELVILEEYLPEMMSADDVRKIVEEKKTALGITDKSKMGMLMGMLMKELKGKADGNVVRQAVEAALEG